jgi:hypothetical protein
VHPNRNGSTNRKANQKRMPDLDVNPLERKQLLPCRAVQRREKLAQTANHMTGDPVFAPKI